MRRSISSKEAKRRDVNFVIAAGALITNLINVKIPELDNRVIPTRGSCGLRLWAAKILCYTSEESRKVSRAVAAAASKIRLGRKWRGWSWRSNELPRSFTEEWKLSSPIVGTVERSYPLLFPRLHPLRISPTAIPRLAQQSATPFCARARAPHRTESATK